MEGGQPVARVGIADEDILPDVERIVAIVGKKKGVGITREREREGEGERERGREGGREKRDREKEREREREALHTYHTINSLLIRHSE